MSILTDKVRIICTDLDGTLLRSDKTISDYSVNILKKVALQGFTVIPVTGRHLGGIPEQIKNADISFAICSNGAGLYDIRKKSLIREESLPEEIILKLLDEFIKLDIMADIFTSKHAYTDYRNLDILKDIDASEPVKDYIRKSRVVVDSIKDFYICKKPDVQKLTINFRKTGSIYKGREEIREILSHYDSLEYVTGGANNIEITAKNATKGKCIEYLSDITGVPLSEIAAIGDTENDISMINTAGIGIAMKNADKELKEISKYITEFDNDEDGAARFIDKMILR